MISNILDGTNGVSYRPWILLALFSALAWSQTELATVFGTINDPTGAVIPGAHVTVVNERTALQRGTLTDTMGQYRLVGLPTGNYTLRTEKEGFQTQAREGIALTSASEVRINVSLTIGDQRQQISVTASVVGI